MLIQALNDYYSVLVKRNDLGREGYSKCDVSYLINLTEDGKFTGFTQNLREETVQKKDKIITSLVPKSMWLPERPRSTTVSANFVENRPGYIFGLEYRAKSDDGAGGLSTEAIGNSEKKRLKLRLQHESFVKEVQEDFGDIDTPVARAYVNFARTWRPENETQNEILLGLKADLNKVKFAFCLDGHPEILLQEDKGVQYKWEMMHDQTADEADAAVCQCAVTGEMLPVAQVHDAVVSGKDIGIRNAGINPSLVNFKPESFLSYGHQQGENACISEKAMKRYTKTLNWLLSSPRNHYYLDDLTVFFWSSDGNEANEQTAFDWFMEPETVDSSEAFESSVKRIMEAAQKGTLTEKKISRTEGTLTPDAQFYIAGVEPNASRIQVKFVYRQRFGRLLENIARHQKDMQIRPEMRPASIARIKKELTSPKITNPEKRIVAPFNSLFQSIIRGTEYPYWCLNTVIARIRTDSDTEDNKYQRLNDVRAGLVKACLIRHTKEEISMALDNKNTDQSYLCGRLFACLEKIQLDAASSAGIKLNKTIGDAYFSSAMSKPAVAFPSLIPLSRHHLAKLAKNNAGWAVNDSKVQMEIMEKLNDEFPKTLNIYEQGKFIIGYYQQKEEFYKKKDEIETV